MNTEYCPGCGSQDVFNQQGTARVDGDPMHYGFCTDCGVRFAIETDEEPDDNESEKSDVRAELL
jgi:hypothetical protein